MKPNPQLAAARRAGQSVKAEKTKVDLPARLAELRAERSRLDAERERVAEERHTRAVAAKINGTSDDGLDALAEREAKLTREIADTDDSIVAAKTTLDEQAAVQLRATAGQVADKVTPLLEAFVRSTVRADTAAVGLKVSVDEVRESYGAVAAALGLPAMRLPLLSSEKAQGWLYHQLGLELCRSLGIAKAWTPAGRSVKSFGEVVGKDLNVLRAALAELRRRAAEPDEGGAS